MMMVGAIAVVDHTMDLHLRGHIAPFADARLRLVPLDALDALQVEAWERLGAEAATTSVFAQPWFMRQSLDHFGRDPDVALAFVENRDGKWLGAIPLAKVSHFGRAPFPHWRGWDHPNQFVGGPLVREGAGEIFWRVLLTTLEQMAPHRFGLRLTNLPLDDDATRALFRLCETHHRDMIVERRFARAKLAPHGLPMDEWRRALPSALRRRIDNLGRKLEREQGEVEFLTVRSPDEVDPWIAAFLRLENAGWKGDARSSLASAPATAGFFGSVIREAAQRGELEIAILRAGGRVMAISTYFLRGTRGFGFKMAYDQACRRYAPGLLLMHRLSGRLIEGGIRQFDSCSVPDQEPVSRLWQQRREFVNCSVAIGGPVQRSVFRLLRACHGWRNRAARKRALAERRD